MRSTRTRQRGRGGIVASQAMTDGSSALDVATIGTDDVPFSIVDDADTEQEEDSPVTGMGVMRQHGALSDGESEARGKLLSSILTADAIDAIGSLGNMGESIMNVAYDREVGRAYCAMLAPAFKDDAFSMPTIDMCGWASNTDFFSAPASTRFHLCTEGGLALHSLSVAKRCLDMASESPDVQAELGEHWREIVTACGMFHDACKADYYVPLDKQDPRNGAWFGLNPTRSGDHEHGELSARIMRKFYGDLLPRHAYDAVEWHMGEWDHRVNPPKWEHIDDDAKDEAIARRERLMRESPFVRMLHEADASSTEQGL